MQNMFKLLIAVLVLGFMVGCGGSGGSGSGGQEPYVNPSISFQEIDSVFPVFSLGAVAANVVLVYKEKAYSISNETFDDFDKSEYAFNSTYGWYTRTDSSTGIEYYLQHNSTAETLLATIRGESLADFSVLNDDVFDDEFDSLDGNLTQALLFVRYDDNISSRYVNYALNLVNFQGFDRCNKNSSTNNKYKCTREGDTFVYIWQENDDSSYFYGAVVK
ncbi:MAG: hypothetical protein LBL65_06035 [Campylobacteraceae bacterium]|jgi:hypothetical protein|nr:hypothetical protein [Campylobacteraceae bacterium]